MQKRLLNLNKIRHIVKDNEFASSEQPYTGVFIVNFKCVGHIFI